MGHEPLKICSGCGAIKPICDFYKAKKGAFGVKGKCKECDRKIRIAHYNAHKKESSEYAKKYRGSNRERLIEYCKQYDAENKHNRNKRVRQRRQDNPKLKLSGNICTGIRDSLIVKKNNRKWESLVDFTVEELAVHLEKQFKPGMSWNNYGEWHIDHKIPVAAFNFSHPGHEDFKKCWCLKNLQPLWRDENLKKSNKLCKPFQPSLAF